MTPSELRSQFVSRADALAQKVKEWAEPHDWVTEYYPKRFRDADDHVYEAKALFLQKGATRVLLDPVAYDVPGAEGVVDLYLMPTYDDMASLFFEQGAWRIHYAPVANGNGAGVTAATQILALSEETINQVLDSIAAHAHASF